MPCPILIPPVSKRKRDSDRETCWVRQLMCIPSISERIARKLLDEYGTLPAIQRALVDIKNFRQIQLDERTCLGKARLKKLSFHLCDAGAQASPTTTAAADEDARSSGS